MRKSLMLFFALMLVVSMLGFVSAYTCADADVNRDNVVNVFDLLTVRQCLNQSASGNCTSADIDKNGLIEEADANLVRQFYLQTCSTQTCTDSDGGLNKYVKGIANYSGYLYDDHCARGGESSQWSEGTADVGDVIEYSCYDSQNNFLCGLTYCHYKVQKCPYGCENGACLKEEIPATEGYAYAYWECKSGDKSSISKENKICKTERQWWNEAKEFCNGEIGTFSTAQKCAIGGAAQTCTDSDGGINYYVRGSLGGMCTPGTTCGAWIDSCIDSITLLEYSCSNTNGERYTCPNGCSNGACIQGGEVKEQVKCLFVDSAQEQKCYTAEQNSRAYCSGKESCVADISGYKGEKITWKSTCGGYAYTTIDEQNEYAKFDCKNIGTCQPTKCDDGSVYECKIENGQCMCPTCPPIIVKPVCGNGICESGEGEVCMTPQMAIVCEKGKECKVPPSSCYVACPQDCKQTSGIYAKLNEKFKLQVYQPVKIVEGDNHLMKITFKDLIAYKCGEVSVSTSAAKTIENKVAVAEVAMTGRAISETVASSAGGGGGVAAVQQPTSILKCVGAGPKALLEVDMIVNNELGKHMILNLDVGEKKQIDDLTISFLGYDYASRTGAFLVSRESFTCRVGCKCDENGKEIECSGETCKKGETLCPDGICREKCNIISEDCKFGCMYEGKCFPMGVRSKGLYCSEDLIMNQQRESDKSCENNFECSSNVCVAGKCISSNFIQKILNWFRKLFGG